MSDHYISSLIESFRKDCEAAHAADRAAWEAKEKALEAENERLREVLRAKVKEWRDDAKNYFMTSSDDCANELEALLNREQVNHP